ncbi:MAG: phytanoyl-CoA dioxygenase family protein [Egibacteraceae bacterium]
MATTVLLLGIVPFGPVTQVVVLCQCLVAPRDGYALLIIRDTFYLSRISLLPSTNAAFFREQGYLHISGVLSEQRVDEIRSAAKTLTAELPPRHDGSVRLDQVVSMSCEVDTLATSRTLLTHLAALIGENIELIENRHNHLTTSRSGSQGRLHRDIVQWTRNMVTVIAYLTDCLDLGVATQVVPGSHWWPCLGKLNNGGTWMDAVSPYSDLVGQALPVPTRAGDVLVMDGMLYHAAGGAGTGERTVVCLAYRSVDELAAGASAPHCRLVAGARIYRGSIACNVKRPAEEATQKRTS